MNQAGRGTYNICHLRIAGYALEELTVVLPLSIESMEEKSKLVFLSHSEDCVPCHHKKLRLPRGTRWRNPHIPCTGCMWTGRTGLSSAPGLQRDGQGEDNGAATRAFQVHRWNLVRQVRECTIKGPSVRKNRSATAQRWLLLHTHSLAVERMHEVPDDILSIVYLWYRFCSELGWGGCQYRCANPPRWGCYSSECHCVWGGWSDEESNGGWSGSHEGSKAGPQYSCEGGIRECSSTLYVGMVWSLLISFV